MSLRTDTTIVQFIWMWILVSVAHGKVIFASYRIYMLSSTIPQVGYCCITHQRPNVSWCTGTTAIRAIGMWILVCLENAQIILVSDCINIIFGNDTNNLLMYTPPIQIWICHWELIPQSLIWLYCKNMYQWHRQREVCIIFVIYDVTWDTNNLVNVTSSIQQRY
jgi:hypothetical protein